MWIIIGITIKGKQTKRWKRMKGVNGSIKTERSKRTKKKIRGKIYHTHDNGGRPFLVVVRSQVKNKKLKIVSVLTYKQFDDSKREQDYDKLVVAFKKVQKVWIGKGTIGKKRGGDNLNKAWTYGNSILLQLNKHLYVFIDHNIYCFKTNEEIIKYYSLIGNSDVPYPVALSKNYAYFMLDCQQIERKKFPKDTDWSNGYSWFFGLKE